MFEGQLTRRRFLVTGVAATTATSAGCTGLLGDEEVQDSDGDGVIDSEDYAPRDPEVQRKEQLVDDDCTCETETPTEDSDATADQFAVDFENPPDAFDGYTESIDGERKLVLRGQEIEYDLPDLSGWERIEYSVMGQTAGNTVFRIRSSEDGRYATFVGIRPWMRWQSAVEGFDGANTYPSVDWEDARPDTEYRVVIDRTGGATGRLTVHGPNGEALYTLGTETIFDVYRNADAANFVPEQLFFKSNRSSERAVFGDVVIR